jgi:hypothetical protein
MATVMPRPFHPRIPPRIPAKAGKKCRSPIMEWNAVMQITRANRAMIEARMVLVQVGELAAARHVVDGSRMAWAMEIVGMLLQVEPPGDIALMRQLVLLAQLQLLGGLAGHQVIDFPGLHTVVESRIQGSVGKDGFRDRVRR